MTTRPQSVGPRNAARDVANLGLVRPPLVYLRWGADPDRYATPIPSWNARCAARSASRRTRNSAVLLLGCEIPGSRPRPYLEGASCQPSSEPSRQTLQPNPSRALSRAPRRPAKKPRVGVKVE